jgi:hypothetical protein
MGLLLLMSLLWTFSTRCTNFSNFVYQAQVQISKGDYSSFLFRGDLKKASGYGFFLFSNGSYGLAVDPGSGSQARTLLEGITIPIALEKAYQVAIVARGSNFDIYLNGSYVNSARDGDATFSSGTIGLGAGTLNTNMADIVYTQVQVWKL